VEAITVSVHNGMFSTHLLKGGTGKPLVFLHGAGGLRTDAPYLEALAQRYTVYAPWHPGFGESEGLEYLDDVHDLATYYLDLFETLGVEQPAVVGHSLGGMIAAEIAAQCSCAVSKLVLVAPVGLWRDDAPVLDIFTMTPKDMAAVSWHDPEGEIARRYTSIPEDPELLANMMIERTQSLSAAGKFLWPIPDKGLKKRIHRIKAPTLIIWGESDRLVPPLYAEEFRSRIPGSTVLIVKQAGHQPPLEQHSQFVSAVTDFVG
jgi:pimeloyl-ACP methyl ester carboxylesterase